MRSPVEGPVRVAVLGAGFWAVQNHLPELDAREDVELVSVCRLGGAELEALQHQYGFRVATESVEEALDADLDAVVVASPNPLHAEHALAAIERGLHVMVEKPLATSPADAWRIVDAAAERDLVAIVPYGWHFKDFVRQARRHLEAGRVGEIRQLVLHMASPTADLFSGAGGYGTAEVDGVTFEADSTTWADPSRAGGYALGQLSHAFGLLAWLTDLRASQVSAGSRRSRTGVDLFDVGLVEYEGGALGTVSGCGALPAQCRFQLDLRIFGSEGMLALDVERERCELRRHDGEDAVERIEPGSGDYDCKEAPHRFIELVRGEDVEDVSPAWTGAAAVETIDALLRSAETGQPIPVGQRVAG